jgi:hypothetical protein
MKGIRTLSLLIACITTTACGSDQSGLDELKRLCEKDAGLTINKAVEVDGFYDTTEGNKNGYLIKKGYKFIEICRESEAITSPTPESGCWRFTKVKRESGKCHKKIDKNISIIIVEPCPEFLKEHCIAVEKIEKPGARYSLHSDFKVWPDRDKVSEFTRSDVYIKNHVTSEVLGRYVSYSYNKKPGLSISKGCEMFEGDYPSYFKSNLINTVLKPMSKGDSHD